MKIKKAQIPLIAFLGGLLGLLIYGFVSEDIKGNKLVKQCNDGKIESCDEVPEHKYGLVTNEIWINDNRHTKLRDFRTKKEKEFYKNVKPKTPKTKEIKDIDVVRFCEDLIKENLKDPSSYKRLTSRDEQIRTGIIRYSGTNSFGGRVQESFKCFDP
tara:strand:+ start:102 stop:572 length:471 start_codon:yes stop_codon:yes gene_type:complete